MKKIGLVGGLGPASTIDYYNGLIQKYRDKHGEDEYPQILIDSVNMHDVIDSIAKNQFETTARIISKSVSDLKAGGAEVVAITANTPHIAWNEMKDSFQVPVISIIDATVNKMKKEGYKKVIIFGTVFTMQSGLYEQKLCENGIEPIVPTDEDKITIGNCIYPNLENGIVIPEDKNKLIEIAEKYINEEHADALLLGCTELPIAIKDGDVSVPILDTTQIHVEEIYRRAEQEE